MYIPPNLSFDYLWYHTAINYIGLFLESFLLLILLAASFGFKKNIRHKKLVFIFSTAVSTFLFIYTGELTQHKGNTIYYMLFFIVGLLFSLVFLNGPKIVGFIQIMIYSSSLLTVSYLVMLFQFITIHYFCNDKMTPLIFTICMIFKRIGANLILGLIVCFMIRNTPKHYMKLPKGYWLSYFILAIFIAFGSYIPLLPVIRTIPFADQLDSLISTSTNIASLLMIYYYFSTTIKQQNEKLKYYLENQQLILQQNHISEVSTLYEDMRKLRHDLKNHIFCMDALLVDHEYDKLHKYFLKLKEPLPHIAFVDAGSITLNAILNSKIALAKENSIKMTTLIQLPETLCIDDLDLCSVVSNLCDNAIEATKLEMTENKPVIHLEIRMINNYLSIMVSNPISHDVLKDNPHLSSSKGDSSMHGLGIKIIKLIAEKYDGMTLFTSDTGKFIATVQLKNQKIAEK